MYFQCCEKCGSPQSRCRCAGMELQTLGPGLAFLGRAAAAAPSAPVVVPPFAHGSLPAAPIFGKSQVVEFREEQIPYLYLRPKEKGELKLKDGNYVEVTRRPDCCSVSIILEEGSGFDLDSDTFASFEKGEEAELIISLTHGSLLIFAVQEYPKFLCRALLYRKQEPLPYSCMFPGRPRDFTISYILNWWKANEHRVPASKRNYVSGMQWTHVAAFRNLEEAKGHGDRLAKHLWQLDGPDCSLCETKFSLLNRPHHCRHCGILMCSNHFTKNTSLKILCNDCKIHIRY